MSYKLPVPLKNSPLIRVCHAALQIMFTASILLFSNEREGIPVHLIHMLDECVEIPQLGIIRSLNVHISGALLIWEYTKQHAFKTSEDT